MTSQIRTTTVCGTEYQVYSDFIKRATIAVNTATGENKVIKSSGYIHNDLTVRKAIALIFGLESFRK